MVYYTKAPLIPSKGAVFAMLASLYMRIFFRRTIGKYCIYHFRKQNVLHVFVYSLFIYIVRNYIKHRTNTIKADYYRRAVEGVEGMDNQPEYKITFSIPLKKGETLASSLLSS